MIEKACQHSEVYGLDRPCLICRELAALRAFRDEVRRMYMESIGLKTLERGIRAALDRLAGEGVDK